MEMLFIWGLFAVVGGALLSSYNKAGSGFLLGLFLGPIGVLIAAVMRSDEKRKEEQRRHNEQLQVFARAEEKPDVSRLERECPFCAELILSKAVVCKHCGRDIPHSASKS